jgi:hypothetical protein
VQLLDSLKESERDARGVWLHTQVAKCLRLVELLSPGDRRIVGVEDSAGCQSGPQERAQHTGAGPR